MDNLKGKTIKQFYFNIDEELADGTTDNAVVITAIIDKTTKMVEWYGHLKGYATIKFLVGGIQLKHKTWKETAEWMLCEFYDDIIDTAIDDDVTEYMGGHSDKAMHGEIKRLVKSYNEKLARIRKAQND